MVEEVFGIEAADLLNNDRIATALPHPRDFLMVGDSKLVSYPNLLALAQAQVRFITPASAAKIPDDLYAGLDIETARLVDYTAERNAWKLHEQRGGYRVLEDTQALAGPRKSDPHITVRRILVQGTANAATQQVARARHLQQAGEQLDKLQHSCAGRYYSTAEKVTARIGLIVRKRRIASCLVTDIGTAVPPPRVSMAAGRPCPCQDPAIYHESMTPDTYVRTSV
ncbi:hypothetical protein [Streptomyces sp. NPDC005799]|uniref:hypothetical protein n=1 Tax=Streptomyces sp. NPDC005799 TaxID=3154678 RepID=UPI0033D34AD7